jgi:hypothetical protein
MTVHGHNLYCPLLTLKRKEQEDVWHGLCTAEHCAWWTGEECAMLRIAKALGKQTAPKQQR